METKAAGSDQPLSRQTWQISKKIIAVNSMLVFEYQHEICGILLCRVFRFVFLNLFVLGNRELF